MTEKNTKENLNFSINSTKRKIFGSEKKSNRFLVELRLFLNGGSSCFFRPHLNSHARSTRDVWADRTNIGSDSQSFSSLFYAQNK